MSALDNIQNARSPYDQTPTPGRIQDHGGIGDGVALEAAVEITPEVASLVTQMRDASTVHANPPEAAGVLETQTAPEIAGAPEPLTDEQVAALAKAEELAELNAARVERGEQPLKKLPAVRKPRRTAPVVQLELDAMSAKYEALAASSRVSGASPEVQAELAQFEAIKEQLTAAQVQIKGLVATEAHLTERLALAEQENERLRALEPVNPERSTPIEILVDECEARGWKVTLSR